MTRPVLLATPFPILSVWFMQIGTRHGPVTKRTTKMAVTTSTNSSIRRLHCHLELPHDEGEDSDQPVYSAAFVLRAL